MDCAFLFLLWRTKRRVKNVLSVAIVFPLAFEPCNFSWKFLKIFKGDAHKVAVLPSVDSVAYT